MLERTQCCGVREYAGLHGKTAPEVIRLIKKQLRYRYNGAIVTFTDVVQKPGKGVGYRMAAIINKHKLGTIVATEPAINPNTRNTIVLWAWTINKENLNNWEKGKK